MHSKRLSSRISLDVLGAGVPAHDVPLGVDHVQGEIANAFDEEPKSLVLLRDIANGGGDEGAMLRSYWTEANLDGNLLPVRPLRP